MMMMMPRCNEQMFWLDFLTREEEVGDVPIDLVQDETGEGCWLVMYTVGSKGRSWTERG